MKKRFIYQDCQNNKFSHKWIQENQMKPIVKMINRENSFASLFQFQYGIPSIIIEMTENKVKKNKE